MYRLLAAIVALILITMSWFAPPCQAVEGSPAPPAENVGLSITPPILDAGDLLGVKEWECKFQLTNTTASPITIDKVVTSCTCSDTKVGRNDLGPGESTELTFKINLNKYKGDFNNSFIITTVGEKYRASGHVRGVRHEMMSQVGVIALEGDRSEKQIANNCRVAWSPIAGTNRADYQFSVALPDKCFEASSRPVESPDKRWIYELTITYQPSLDPTGAYADKRIEVPAKLSSKEKTLDGAVVIWTKLHDGVKVLPAMLRFRRSQEAEAAKAQTIELIPFAGKKLEIVEIKAGEALDVRVVEGSEHRLAVSLVTKPESAGSDQRSIQQTIVLKLKIGDEDRILSVPVVIY
jgi:hypothetical protein